MKKRNRIIILKGERVEPAEFYKIRDRGTPEFQKQRILRDDKRQKSRGKVIKRAVNGTVLDLLLHQKKIDDLQYMAGQKFYSLKWIYSDKPLRGVNYEDTRVDGGFNGEEPSERYVYAGEMLNRIRKKMLDFDYKLLEKACWWDDWTAQKTERIITRYQIKKLGKILDEVAIIIGIITSKELARLR